MRVETPKTDCVKTPPPAEVGRIFHECDGWEACLTFENAGKLIAYLRASQRWMRQTNLACATPEPPETDTETDTEGN